MKLYEHIEQLKKSNKVSPDELMAISNKFYELAKGKLKFNSEGSSTFFQSQVSSVFSGQGAHLEVMFTTSIDYSYIPTKYAELKSKLNNDNIQMEFTYINQNIKNDTERFVKYCESALFQIENLLNYYYHVKFPNEKLLLKHLQENSNYTHKGEAVALSYIPIATKIFDFSKTFFPYNELATEKDYTGSTLSNINKVRNAGLHRCDVIEKTNEDEKLKKFLQYKHQNYSVIRNSLLKMSEKIKVETNTP